MPIDDLWHLTRPPADATPCGEHGKLIASGRHGRGKRYRVRYTDPDGAVRQKLFDKKSDAELVDVNTRADITRGNYIDPDAGRRTFRDFAEEWRRSQVHADTTQLQIETLFRVHVYPHPQIGGRPLAAIRKTAVQGFIRSLQDDLAPRSVLVVYRHMASVFLAAVADRLIPTTPCVGITLPEIEPKRVEPLPTETVDGIRNATAAQFRVLVDEGSMAGLRQGEAFGLEVGHIDFLRRTIRVCQQLKCIPGERPFLAPPKTRKSYRTIPVAQLLLDRLAAHLAEFPAREIEVVDKTGKQPVTRKARLVVLDDGDPLRRATYGRAIWRPALRRASVEGGPTFHDLRHFYASALIAHGASATQVQARLGHATTQETWNTYAHLWPDDDDKTRAAIEAAFAPKAARLRAVP